MSPRATKLRPSKIYKGAGGRIAINSRVPLFTRQTVSLEEFYINFPLTVAQNYILKEAGKQNKSNGLIQRKKREILKFALFNTRVQLTISKKSSRCAEDSVISPHINRKTLVFFKKRMNNLVLHYFTYLTA